MKRLLRILGICLICGAMAVPQFDATAQGRRPGVSDRAGNRGNHNNNGSGNHNRRPNQGNHNGGGNQRPNQGNHNGGNQRPNQGNHNGGNQRPNQGNHNGSGNHYNPRPNPGNHGSGNHYNPRPNPGNHGGGNHYNPRPNPGNHRPTPPPPPPRPQRPVFHWHGRPAPPPSFRPHYHLTPLQAIFGFALGTAFNLTLDRLYATNCIVDGYADNQLFLRNVNAFNMVWPDAILTYSNGYLAAGNFSYSTPFYDSSCYNRVYARLNSMYGVPISTNRQGNGVSATWWGYDNRYVTLDFRPYYAVDGSLRYYTTLTVG